MLDAMIVKSAILNRQMVVSIAVKGVCKQSRDETNACTEM